PARRAHPGGSALPLCLPRAARPADERAGARSMSFSSGRALLIARPLVAVVLVGLWIAYIELAHIPSFVLPHPKDVAVALYEQLRTGQVLPHLAATAQ